MIQTCWNWLGFWGRIPFVSVGLTGLCYGTWLLVQEAEAYYECGDWKNKPHPVCRGCHALEGLVIKHYSDFQYFFMAQVAVLFAMLVKMTLGTLGGV